MVTGCTPKGRLTEQHDIFFELNFCKDLVPEMKVFFGQKLKKFTLMLMEIIELLIII
jgi:hypothetical protein